ncbi:MAG: hypothetical protein DHS20C15_04110 [Planctomycetota bacterium]|nr:MAG: hypothetical protein DHS20C15_04110 [Planctomycetota bacterium]
MTSAAANVLGCSDSASDAVQDTLMRIWSKGWLPSDPRGALCYLARKSSLQQLRAARRRCHHEECAASDSERCLHAEEPSAILARREEAREVRRAVAELSPAHREVLELQAFEGLEYAELAERLALPVGTVRSRLNRARSALRERLERPAAASGATRRCAS